MERIQSLINRLQEQLSEKANAAHMLATVQLLQAELSQLASSSNKTLGTSKVSVLMPASPQFINQEKIADVETPSYAKPKPKPRNQLDLHFDPLNEVPTFSNQQFTREVNESVSKEESLNDKLKEEKKIPVKINVEQSDLEKQLSGNEYGCMSQSICYVYVILFMFQYSYVYVYFCV